MEFNDPIISAPCIADNAMSIYDLPLEDTYRIEYYLPIRDVINLSKTCRDIHRPLRYNDWWRMRTLEEYSNVDVPADNDWRHVYRQIHKGGGWAFLSTDGKHKVTPIDYTDDPIIDVLYGKSEPIGISISGCAYNLTPADRYFHISMFKENGTVPRRIKSYLLLGNDGTLWHCYNRKRTKIAGTPDVQVEKMVDTAILDKSGVVWLIRDDRLVRVGLERPVTRLKYRDDRLFAIDADGAAWQIDRDKGVTKVNFTFRVIDISFDTGSHGCFYVVDNNSYIWKYRIINGVITEREGVMWVPGGYKSLSQINASLYVVDRKNNLIRMYIPSGTPVYIPNLKVDRVLCCHPYILVRRCI